MLCVYIVVWSLPFTSLFSVVNATDLVASVESRTGVKLQADVRVRVYAPQGIGLLEFMPRHTLFIRKVIQRGANWSKRLLDMEKHWNTMPGCKGVSPFELVYQRKPILGRVPVEDLRVMMEDMDLS